MAVKLWVVQFYQCWFREFSSAPEDENELFENKKKSTSILRWSSEDIGDEVRAFWGAGCSWNRDDSAEINFHKNDC